MVYYRKYRPQTIAELDSAAVRETLTAVLKSVDIPHAFLFTGPKGLGKTSAARIIAKIVNCEKRQPETGKKGSSTTIDPCNECDMCVSITNGTNMDILEIDAASNRGIDEIRDLKEKIRLAPLRAVKKIYIIDEVHMLTTEAFNALLKTLEEPPSHALFILCTTEPHKVPATILSRCFHVQFKKATHEELKRSFQRIAQREGLVIDTDALDTIAKLSDGGFRDGAKTLEELASLAQGKQITKELIDEKYHTLTQDSVVTDLLEQITKKDTKMLIKTIQEAAAQSLDMKYLTEQLIGRLHQQLLSKTESTKQAAFTIGELQTLFQLLSRAHAESKYAVIPELPLELALIEWSLGKEKTMGVTEEVITPKDTSVSVQSLRKQVGTLAKTRILEGEIKEKKDDEKESTGTTDVSLLHAHAEGDLTPEWLAMFWKQIILKMKEYNHTVAGVLRGCQLISFDRKTVVIQTAYKFHKDRLDEGKTRDALVNACASLIGSPVLVSIVLKGK